MKKLFTLLVVAFGFVAFANAASTTYTLTEADYQAIVDYSNAQGLNSSDKSEDTDNYYGASSYYKNFDFREESFNVGGSFANWAEAAQEAISMIVLPLSFAEATDADSIAAYFKYYDGESTKYDYFIFEVTAADPLTFAAISTEGGNYKADILSFELADKVTDAEIDNAAQTIEIMVAPGTDVTALVPTMAISEGATVDPALDAAVDFTSPVTYTVTAENGTTVKQWVVSVSIMEESLTSIYDIQYVADPATDDASPLFEETVIVKGIVTGFASFGSYNKYYVQDGAGPWNGIYVYDRETGVVLNVGDEVKLTGTVDEYYGVSEIAATKVEILSSRNTLPEAEIITGALTEEVEGIIVTVEGVTIAIDEDPDDHEGTVFMIAEKDGISYKIFGELFDAFTVEEGKKYKLTGVVAYTREYYRICPRSANDIEVETSVNSIKASFEVYPNPAENVLNVSGIDSDMVSIKNISGQTVASKMINNGQIDISNLENGVYIIESENRIARFIKK